MFEALAPIILLEIHSQMGINSLGLCGGCGRRRLIDVMGIPSTNDEILHTKISKPNWHPEKMSMKLHCFRKLYHDFAK
jgi:hypothetical protein